MSNSMSSGPLRNIPAIECSGMTYNASGQPISGTVGGLAYTWTYDAQGRLETITRAGKTSTVSYDGDGHVSGVA